jgi:hypothetical protein
VATGKPVHRGVTADGHLGCTMGTVAVVAPRGSAWWPYTSREADWVAFRPPAYHMEAVLSRA